MRVFIAGIMQGDRQDHDIGSQDYRLQITQALQTHLPHVEIIDPWALNPGSIHYDDERARHTFLNMTRLARQANLLIAYIPQPSMGTAMEMWEAYQANAYIIAITPLRHHWAIRFTANEVLPDLDTLLADIENGRIGQILNGRSVDEAHIAD